MKLKKIFESIFYKGKWHGIFTNLIIDNIISYFDGKITFDEIGFTSSHKGNAWYLDSYTEILNSKSSDFIEISKDTEKFKRILKVYFYLIEGELGEKAQEIDIQKISEIYPEFYNEIISKDKIMRAIFVKESKWNSKSGIEKLCNIFGKIETFNFIKNSPELKSKGYYNSENNLECFILTEDIIKLSENENLEEFKKSVLNYLTILSNDYNCTDEYNSRSKIPGHKFRKSLSDDEKKALLELIDTGNNWDENIKFLIEKLIKVKTGRSGREKYSLIENDKDFYKLFEILNKIEGIEFVNRFKQMIFEITPHFYINENYFKDIRSYCAWTDGKKVVDSLKYSIKNNPEFENQLVDYIVLETVEHYQCNYKTQDEAFKLLIEEFGSDYIKKHLKTRSIFDEIEAIYLMDKYGDKKSVETRKEELEEIILDSLLTDIAVDEESALELKKYINEYTDEINIKKSLKKKIEETGNFSEYHLFSGEKLKRLVKLILESKNKELLFILPAYFYKGEETELPHKFMLREIIDLNINTKEFLKVLVEYISNHKNRSDDEKFLYNQNYYEENILLKTIKYLEDNGINCLELGAKFNAKLKKIILDGIYMSDTSKREAIKLLDFLGEKQKSIVTSALRNLKNLDKSVITEVEDKIYNEIENYLNEKEILAVEVLCHYASDKEKLKNLYNIVNEPKSRDLILESVGLELDNLYKDNNNEFDLDSYLDSVYKKSRKFPIEIDKLTLPVRKDEKDSTKAVEQLIILYKNSDELAINKEALLIANCFTPESIKIFAKSTFSYWLNGKMDMKSKWQLLIPIIHGDYALIKELAELIENLAKNSRQKLAVYLIKALGLNGTKEAFIAIDKIGRRTKFKTLRQASGEAFEIAAEQLGITKGELGDQLVGDMGLTDGYISLNYGNQIIKLFVGNNLKFEIEKEDGKRVKTLPKGTKDDDETLVAEAKEKFKILKKQLKDMITLQTNRMEDALVSHRLWNASKWKELFLKNPIMNNIGKSLIWGIYEESKLVKSFAFDSEIFDTNYENIDLEDNQLIGIIHPLELSKEELESWKEVFSDNEQEILFDQLDREILEAENEKALEFRPKDYPRKSSNTLINRLRKKGWNIGSVRDAGSFNEIYKEIKELNIGIELTLDTFPWAGGFGYETDSSDGLAGVEKIEFYRLNTITRGSYNYDELEEHNGLRYMPKELPKRIVSELLFELKKGLS